MPTNNPNKTLGQNIKLLREKLNLTQENVASYLNTSREQFAYFENGTRNVSTTQLSKLADLFCVDEFDFYEEDDNKRKLNISFAFRADSINQIDLENISKFKKIVRNYLNMKTALANE